MTHLRRAAAKGVPLVGLCTGSFVLAEAGQLDGVRCAVHVDHVADFKDRYPEAIPLPNAIYSFDQDRVTCPGGTAAIDVAVEILSQRCGVSRGTKGLSAMVVDQHRKAHPGVVVGQGLDEQGGVQRPPTLQRPEGMDYRRTAADSINLG